MEGASSPKKTPGAYPQKQHRGLSLRHQECGGEGGRPPLKTTLQTQAGRTDRGKEDRTQTLPHPLPRPPRPPLPLLRPAVTPEPGGACGRRSFGIPTDHTEPPALPHTQTVHSTASSLAAPLSAGNVWGSRELVLVCSASTAHSHAGLWGKWAGCWIRQGDVSETIWSFRYGGVTEALRRASRAFQSEFCRWLSSESYANLWDVYTGSANEGDRRVQIVTRPGGMTCQVETRESACLRSPTVDQCPSHRPTSKCPSPSGPCTGRGVSQTRKTGRRGAPSEPWSP
ncbi:hypothetical protein JZ751_023981, partial [Albula glossodonta]